MEKCSKCGKDTRYESCMPLNIDGELRFICSNCLNDIRKAL